MTVNFLNERKMEFMNAFILAGYIFLSRSFKKFTVMYFYRFRAKCQHLNKIGIYHKFYKTSSYIFLSMYGRGFIAE